MAVIDRLQPDQPSPPERRPRRSLSAHLQGWNRLTTGTFVIVVATLVVLLGANRLWYEPRVRDSVEAARLMRLVHESMVDQETSLRGFLLTRQSELLDTYQAGRSQLRVLTPELESRLTGRSDLGPMLVDLRVAQQEWIDEWVPAALVAGRTRQDLESVTSVVRDGKVLFDTYRVEYEVLSSKLADERDRRIDEQSFALLLIVLAALVLTVVSGVLARRRVGRLQRAVEDPLAAMLDRLARLRMGDFAVTERVDGPAELQKLDDGLRDAAQALAQARENEEEQSSRIFTQNRHLAQVLRLAREIAGSLNLRYVLRGVATAASAISERRVIVWLRTDDGMAVEPRADTAAVGMEPIGLGPVVMGDGVVGRAARFGRLEGHRTTLLDQQDAMADEVAVPMVVGAEVIGVLQISGGRAPDMPPATLDVLEALAVQAASAIGAARLHEYTETLALTDPLTRLPNRRQLDRDLGIEVSVSGRYGRPLGFAMLDVDHFKVYNDTLGHQAGDVALQFLAGVLRECLRTGDTLYRYGGEELCLVLREASAVDAAALLERMRAAVEHAFTAPDQPLPVTISAGVASLPDHGRTAAELIATADAALYAAKASGRNRVCVADAAETGQLSGH